MPFLSKFVLPSDNRLHRCHLSAFTLSACHLKNNNKPSPCKAKTMGTTYTVKYLSDGQDKLPSPAEIQKTH